MRIYISGPVEGTADKAARFSKAQKELEKDFPGAEIVNPIHMERYRNFLCPEELMTLKMQLLAGSVCDAIYLLEGWEQSCTANRELGYARGKCMTELYQTGRSEHE